MENSREPGKYWGMQLLAVFCALALGIWILYVNKSYYHDDAYITLRYVWNFLNGNGIVWNDGEFVQGYSNFLHLALITAFGLTGADLVWLSRAIGLFAFSALVLVLAVFLVTSTRTSPRRRVLWHIPVIFTLTSAPMIVWSIGGLGDTLLAFFTASGCLLFMAAIDQPGKRRLLAASGICFALGYLAHPDGLVFVCMSMLWLFVTARQSRTLRSALAFAVPCLLILGIYTLWQYFYYGDIVPNTFYAKAGNFTIHRLATGARYIQTYALQPPYLPILILATLLFGFVSGKLHWNSKLTYLALLISAYGSFIVYIGGDHMRAFRLILPLVVPMACLLYLLLTAMVGASSRMAASLLTLAVLLLSTLQLGQEQLNPMVEDPASRVGTLIGKYIAVAWPQGSLIALNTAGSTPYYAPRNRYIDMLGLNDRHIAKRHIDKIQLPLQHRPGHLKGDGVYVLSRKPDFIILGPSNGKDISHPWFLSDLEIGRDPRFAQQYAGHSVMLGIHDDSGQVSEVLFTYYQRVTQQ